MSDLDGAFLCTRGSKPPTPEDLAIVAEFARRLASGATPKETPMKQVHVTPHRPADEGGGWSIIAGPFRTQDVAIDAARDLARDLQLELVIHGEDGQIREKDSHGHDPKEIRG